jgi:UTP--glucose-1-phosphate uridylyltransferase
METEGMELEIIINPKVTDDGQSVVQVRTLFRRAVFSSHIQYYPA